MFCVRLWIKESPTQLTFHSIIQNLYLAVIIIFDNGNYRLFVEFWVWLSTNFLSKVDFSFQINPFHLLNQNPIPKLWWQEIVFRRFDILCETLFKPFLSDSYWLSSSFFNLNRGNHFLFFLSTRQQRFNLFFWFFWLWLNLSHCTWHVRFSFSGTGEDRYDRAKKLRLRNLIEV